MSGRKLRWLADHGFVTLVHNQSSDYVEAHDKSLIAGDIMIDDYWKNLESANVTHKILFDQSHNQSVVRYPRAKGWADLTGVMFGWRKLER
jgi:5'(3')-deoxyribonucleotidase